MKASLLVEPLDLPTVDRPVGERVALGRRAAERPRPGAGVAEMEVEKDAVGVESNQRARHGGTLAKARGRRCPAKDRREPLKPASTCPIIALLALETVEC